MEIEEYLKNRRKLVDEALIQWLPQIEPSVNTLGDAMRYCIFPGGKRLRPTLAIMAAESVGGSVETALLPAVALEFMHTSSLIYDDLPCMDGGEMRRGKPACHKMFGEAVALLAAHCLFSHGMALCCHENLARRLSPLQLSRLITEVGSAVGPNGLAGGQFLDLFARNALAQG
jgi:geranylgeranyl diphosphate synthase type II